MTPDVRHITEVTDSLQEAFERLMPQLSPRLTSPSRERLERIAGGSSTALFVACDGKRIVGLLTLAWYEVSSGRKAWIEDVVVDTAARGCGAGEMLVRAAAEYARSIGAGQVLLTSSSAREAARALYRKIGFVEVNTTVFSCKTDTE